MKAEFIIALRKLYPLIPDVDAERAFLSANKSLLKDSGLTRNTLYWSAAAVARHYHTDYDSRLRGGATKQAARTATRAEVRAKLRAWGGPDTSTPVHTTSRVSWDRVDWSRSDEAIARSQRTTLKVVAAQRSRRLGGD